MSKKYDEYVNQHKDQAKVIVPIERVHEMLPDLPEDKDLERELRDRAIIAYVTYMVKSGKPFTYADVREVVDNDTSEREYEEGQGKTM